MKNKYLKVTETIITLLLFVLILILIWVKIQVSASPTQIPSIFGIRLMTVLTGSMKPSLNPGDVIVSKSILPVEIKLDDIITYRTNNNVYVTHRVVDLKHKGNQISFKTKGDYNNTLDNSLINSNQLVGIVLLKIPKLGHVSKFIRTPLGFVLLIVMPILALTIKELKNSLLSIINYNKKI